ncbi:hypothetical protein [Pusillimonas noertemannii]|nr:hypothetical protein [Pusillimonas noertemannii]NYT67709.1 hypothetical protein [Pusillimonas noertemannii]TFL12135.1 hypothetical protein CSC72_03165 [Pusillimonas noertemannii]
MIERLMKLEVVIERRDMEVDEWGGTEIITYVPLLTTKAAFAKDSTMEKVERIPGLLGENGLEYTDHLHVAYIPYSDIPQDYPNRTHMLRHGDLRYLIVGVLNLGALNKWTQLVLDKGRPVE